MSSLNHNAGWPSDAPGTRHEGSARSLASPERSTATQTPGEIAGQVSEHLTQYARRARLSLAASASLPLLAPDAATALSAEEQRAFELLYEQKMAPPPSGTPFLIFTLNNLRWGVPAPQLREVLPGVPVITPLPFSPRWLHGLINLRGEPVGLVNLAELLLDPVTAASLAQRTTTSGPVIVAESGGALLGLLVEALGEVIFIEENMFSSPPVADIRALPPLALTHIQATCTLAESASPLLLLDLARLTVTLLQELTAREALND